MKFFGKLLVLILFPMLSLGQTLEGEFSQLSNQPIKLLGFDNFETYVIDSTQTDSEGKFTLMYSKGDYGMGLLKSTADQPLIIAIEEDAPVISGENFLEPEKVTIKAGQENKWFLEYATEHPKRQQALSAWLYLDNLYSAENVFDDHKPAKESIADEIQHLRSVDEAYINNLPEDSYMKWYLPLRTLVSGVQDVAVNKPQLIPETREGLRAINYNDERLYKSGLLYTALFNHIWFIENSSGGLDQVFKALNTSIDIIAKQLKDNDARFNLIMEKMLEILEERSLFTSSEYLAEKLLQGDDCGCLNPQLQKKLQRYGKMAKGQTAPNIQFTDFTYYPKDVTAESLKDIDADYKLVVFAAGWCPHCVEAMPKIIGNYDDWKAKGVEVILVSLDENPKDFARFAGPLPFVSTTDYKKWDGKAVEDYQVYATPSYFILDKDLEILIRPKSVEHIDAWVGNIN
jgi:thiol-disulfide isomerase/thioredoxin